MRERGGRERIRRDRRMREKRTREEAERGGREEERKREEDERGGGRVKEKELERGREREFESLRERERERGGLERRRRRGDKVDCEADRNIRKEDMRRDIHTQKKHDSRPVHVTPSFAFSSAFLFSSIPLYHRVGKKWRTRRGDARGGVKSCWMQVS